MTMQLQQQDTEGRIFSCADWIDPTVADQLARVDWLSLPWSRPRLQEHWPRRQIGPDSPWVDLLQNQLHLHLAQINQVTGQTFQQGSTVIWVDLPGFVVPVHTDGSAPSSVQLYWHMPIAGLGTCFYQHSNAVTLVWQAPGVVNTGYVAVTAPNPDGSQPLVWHGMLCPVPAGTIRVSSHHQLR